MGTKIIQGEDGSYRWIYEFRMLKNPIILLTIWKIFLYILLGLWAVFGLFGIRSHGFVGAYIEQAKALLLPAAILLGLSVIAYLILAGIYGWTYVVLFEMDEKGIRHIQMDKQFKKAQALGFLTAAVGLAAGKSSAAGAGLLSAVKNEQYSEFGKVKRVRVFKAFHTIKLNALLNYNQVYAEPEDFEFVAQFIAARVAKEADSGRL